ncbi:hypothetical protein PHYPSEUDO_005386 [Phytophthora pseudosyringae]|uniref:N-acetyltransferase domain-containing protein n=1 Tax=Phytophthora pseudosyringae TaxID=221518 RepID=A0A8T1VL46_9STRA|nr:hypothetical protein PHYPSEUDO_005386 [Phytophthora pseudosyringae]
MQLRPLREERDVQRVVALEAAALAANEVAGETAIRSRLRAFGPFFLVAHDTGDELVGFISGTLTAAEETMDVHDPDGSTLCIRSVVVARASRRLGIAVRMLKQYVERICSQQPQVRRVVFFANCNIHLLELFVKVGFAVTGLRENRLKLVFDCEARRQVPFVQVDAFTRKPFQGNPAAVILLQSAAFHRNSAAEWMQRVAREKNLNATAFVALRTGPGDGDVVEYDIKWFSPVVELTLCGHGTLSSAVALLDRGRVLPTQTIHFYNRTCTLVCHYETTVDQGFCVVMDFPCKMLTTLPAGTTPDAIATALGIPRTGVLDTQLALNDVIVRVDKASFLDLKPDFHHLAAIDTGFAVTTEASADHPADFQSRFFAPRIGINEDPVTGSAHCGLGPYWSKILGKTKLTGHQSTPVRGGFVEIDLSESQPGRVLLRCQGVVVAHGVLTSPQ